MRNTHKIILQRKLLYLSFAILTALIFSAHSNATTRTWDGGADNNWSTAAAVSVGGKITNAKGRGIASVRVISVDAQRNLTGGYDKCVRLYKFTQIAAAQSVTTSVRSKKFVFANPTRTVNVLNGLDEINFIAENL